MIERRMRNSKRETPLWWWRPRDAGLASAVLCLLALAPVASAQEAPVVAPTDVVVVGDAIPTALTGAAADARRGRAVVLDRANGNCLICHQLPEPAERFQGTIGPTLSGVGSRLTPAQLRLRLVDQSRVSPATLMPPFYRTANLSRVDVRYLGKPVLAAGDIEDVVAYLSLLKD